MCKLITITMPKITSILTKQSLTFFENYINNPSPTSFEAAGQKLWMDYIKPYVDEIQHDTYGTCYGIINPGQPYKVVIEAHADEISWYVNYISDDGLIYVIRNGGSDHLIAPSKKVIIHTRSGKQIVGVFGWPAIHTRKDKDEETPKVENITVDVGAKTKEEVLKMDIHVGCVITYPDEFMVLNDRYFVGRALDNRAGGFMIAEVARLLKENKKTLPYTLYIVNAVQEEVGLYGAKMIAQTLKPDVAICTDVTHDTTTPMIDKKKTGECKCGAGPAVTWAPSIQRNLLELILDTAKTHDIPLQYEARSRYSGTDTDAFAFDGNAASALISLPLRYMHTTVEMVEKSDVEGCIKLMYETLLRIKSGQDFRYHTL